MRAFRWAADPLPQKSLPASAALGGFGRFLSCKCMSVCRLYVAVGVSNISSNVRDFCITKHTLMIQLLNYNGMKLTLAQLPNISISWKVSDYGHLN